MRYYTEKTKDAKVHAKYFCRLNHPLYNSCCLFETKEGTGLAIVQRYFNPKMKVYWYGAVESWIMDEVVKHDDFLPYIYKNSEEAILGVYPTVNIRQVMYALKMKPLKKEWWESQGIQPI